MAEKDDRNTERACSRLLELIEDEEWEFSTRARREGKIALRWLHNRKPTDWEMVEYVASRLKTYTGWRCSPQGDPPGSGGLAWQVTDERNVFIKLKLDSPLTGKECAYIQSIHESDHPRN